jgi:hypothetical protein
VFLDSLVGKFVLLFSGVLFCVPGNGFSAGGFPEMKGVGGEEAMVVEGEKIDERVATSGPVVESTGEAQQEEETAMEDIQPPAVDAVPETAPTEARIEPETGILKEEPGQISDDPSDEADSDSAADKGEGNGSGEDLEEGEMVGEERSEGEIEDDGPPEVTVGGKCYMDMEKGGVADSSDHGYRRRK